MRGTNRAFTRTVQLSAASALLWACGQAHAQFGGQAVALTGTDGLRGPGLAAGVTFGAFSNTIAPSINALGQVAFYNTVTGTGTPGGAFVFTNAATANTNVGIFGGPQPGGGTYSASSGFNSPVILNDSGGWAARSGSVSALNGGVFSDVSGNLSNPQRVALMGDVAPGTGGATFSTAGPISAGPLFNSAGQSMFIASLTNGTGANPSVNILANTSNSTGIWVGTPGAVNLVLRQNQALGPDVAGGLAGVGLSPSNPNYDATGNTRIGSLSTTTIAMNDSGAYVAQMNLQGSGAVTGTGAGSNSVIMATNRGGTFTILARVGSPSPDAAGNATSDLFRGFQGNATGFNNLGHVAFSASVRDAAGVQTNAGVRFTDAGSGVLRQISRQNGTLPSIYSMGDTAGTTPLVGFDGTTWASQGSVSALNANEMVVFQSTFGPGGTGRSGIFAFDGNTNLLHRVAVVGDVATGATSTVANDIVTFFGNFSTTPVVNALNQVAFVASLASQAGTGVTGASTGLFASLPDGTLMCIAQVGRSYTVAPGDVRTVSSIGAFSGSGGEDGRATSLNDSGQLVYRLAFSDNSSGLFVTTVPTPGAVALLGIGGVLASRRRRAGVSM